MIIAAPVVPALKGLDHGSPQTTSAEEPSSWLFAV